MRCLEWCQQKSVEKCRTSGGDHWWPSKCGGQYQLKGSIRLNRWSLMFQKPLEQTRSLPLVENIFASSSPRPRLMLNRCSKWWSMGCWLRMRQYWWHPRPIPCHIWRENTSLHLVFYRRPDRGRPIREWGEGQRCQVIFLWCCWSRSVVEIDHHWNGMKVDEGRLIEQ